MSFQNRSWRHVWPIGCPGSDTVRRFLDARTRHRDVLRRRRIGSPRDGKSRCERHRWDGVSAAFGVAAVASGPVVLLIGDVALAHDIGGLLAARRLGLALTIIVLHNDGGGIFHFLPVTETDPFEEHVATPHGLSFVDAAGLYDCDFSGPKTIDDLRDAVASAVTAPRTTIIEVRTERARNLVLHRLVAQAALEALTTEPVKLGETPRVRN